MPLIAEALAAFAAETRLEATPASVRSRAKHLVLDGVGIAYASTTFDFARVALAALKSFEPGDATVIGFSDRLALRDAVTLNGILVHGLDFDDTHLEGVVHATASCLPTALAVAALNRRSGADLLAAYIVGMEAAARLGSVAHGEMNQIGFHPTGVVAAFACALIAGRLEGLDVEQLVQAQGIALSLAAGTREYSTNGSMTKRLHPGWAAACGITAARLAAHGYTGPRTTYEGQFGLYATHLSPDRSKWDLDAATRGLGSAWETLNVAIKPYPACQLSISCIDAAIAIAERHRPSPADIERIDALVPPHAVKIVCEPLAEKRRPASAYAAQFSLPYCIACALVEGRFGLAELERHRDPALLALADKVHYALDPHTGYPRHFSGEVIVTLKDGRRLSHRQQINLGAADNPVPDSGIVAKFMANAELATTEAHARAVRDMILEVEALPDARTLADVLARK